MQEYIINGLLVVVALLAVILQIIGTRPTAGMTKKQKVMLWRILTATVLLLILQVLGAGAFEVFGAAGRWIRLAVFMVDYLVIGYDILEKAGKGIRNGQVFDEHFLMRWLRWVRLPWPYMKTATIWRPSRLCCSTRWANGSSLMLWARAAGISVI